MLQGAWLVVLSGLVLGPVDDQPVDPTSALAKATGPWRPTEGRLTGGFSYGPYPSADRGPTDLAVFVQLAGRLAAESAKSPSARSLHHAGRVLLLQRRSDEAIASLAQAAERAPEDPSVRSDLAAAYLERSRVRADPQDIWRALESVEVALLLAPTHPEARFNRGIALEKAYLLTSARDEWLVTAAQESQSPWASEAQARAAAMAGPGAGTRWKETERRLRAGPGNSDSTAVEQAVEGHPQEVRRFILQQAIPEWRGATLTQPAQAQEISALADRLGRALEKRWSDPFLLEAWAALQAASSQGGIVARTIDSGLLVLEKADALWDAGRYSEAAPSYDRAEGQLASLGQPLAELAVLQRARCLYYAGDLQSSRALLQRLLTAPASRRSAWITGTVWRSLGLLEHLAGDFQSALHSYSTAEALLILSGDEGGLAQLESLMAELYGRLGEAAAAWRYRWRCLDRAHRAGTQIPRQNTLLDAANALQNEGLPRAALAVQHELVREFMAADDPQGAALALVDRAQNLQALGRLESAERDLAEARTICPRIVEVSERERTIAEVSFAIGALNVMDDPRSARAHLEAARSSFRRAGIHHREVAIQTLVARSWRVEGDGRRASETIEAGIEKAEAEDAHLADVAIRQAYSDALATLYDEAVDLSFGRGNAHEALSMAERGRARILRMTLDRSGGGEASPLRADTIVHTLPRDLALVEFAVLRDRVLVWVVRRGSLHCQELADSRAIEDKARALRRSLEARATASIYLPLLEDLFEALVRPIEVWIAGAEGLIIAPHRWLHDIPFAALRDRTRRLFLVEDYPLTVVTSASVFLHLENSARTPRTQPGPAVLVVAGSSYALDGTSEARALRTEAVEVASLHGDAKLLEGREATPERFLEAVGRSAVVHVAAHGLANSSEPNRSYLSFEGGGADHSRATPLFASALSGRELSGVRTLVLSACRSAAGRPSATEGILSLAHWFLAAGVGTVVGSLWAVDDSATRTFMLAFHRGLEEGRSTAASLRQAQIESIKEGEFSTSEPSNWAAFVSLGVGFERPLKVKPN